MGMTKGDAVYLNRLCEWMAGGRHVTTDEAYEIAARLADRAHAVLGAGVTGREVRAAYTEDGAEPYPDLLAAMWAVQEGDGTWSGGDGIAALTAVLERHGLDITHPAHREGSAKPTMHEWHPDALRAVARASARTTP